MPDLFVSKENEENKKSHPVKPRRLTVEGKSHERTGKPGMEGINADIPISHNPISAFNYYPRRVNFRNKDPEEKVILLLRKHPITNLGWISLTFILVILPPFISAMPFLDGVPFRFVLLAGMIWYLLTFVYAFEAFLNWYFSVNIITDERIFDFDFYNLTYRKVTDVNIDKIQDVTVSIAGGIGTVFNFGDVLVQTAAEITEIDFDNIPQPDKVAKILREMRLEEEVEQMEGRIR
jgi:hypothetical protein